MSSPSAAPMSNFHFWLFTIGILIVWTILFAAASPASTSSPQSSVVPIVNTTALYSPKDEIKNTRNCKALCEHCGCLGFYCGEECICECNKDNQHSDTECIATMQDNARKLDIPFEILIQGPSANSFVRNALQFDQNKELNRNALPPEMKNTVGRNKRSTVVIYKPSTRNSLDIGAVKKVATKDMIATDTDGDRHKRAVNKLEWFSDLTNTLVRPAPLTGARKSEKPASVEEPKEPSTKRSTNELDRSWFTETTDMLLRPAPIFKRRTDQEGSFDGSLVSTVGSQLPEVIKETIRSIKDTAVNDEFNDAIRKRIQDGTEIIHNNVQSNFDLFSKNLGNGFEDTLSNMKMLRKEVGLPEVSMPSPIQPQPPTFLIPWFRPMRFLQRVHDAIN